MLIELAPVKPAKPLPSRPTWNVARPGAAEMLIVDAPETVKVPLPSGLSTVPPMFSPAPLLPPLLMLIWLPLVTVTAPLPPRFPIANPAPDCVPLVCWPDRVMTEWSTVIVPKPPAARPTLMIVAVTAAWFDTEREPVPLRPTPRNPLSPLSASRLPAPVTTRLPVPPAAVSLLPPTPPAFANILDPPPMVRVPALPAALPTCTAPVAPVSTTLPPLIVMNPVPLGPPTCSDAPVADPVKVIVEPPDMFSVPVPAARALVPPRTTLAPGTELSMLMCAPFCRFSKPFAPTPRPTRTPAPMKPLKLMTPSRFTVDASIVAAPDDPATSATANLDALIWPPDVRLRLPEPVSERPTLKSRSPLPSTDTEPPLLMVICPRPPSPICTYGVVALPPVEETTIDEPMPDTVTVPVLPAAWASRRPIALVGAASPLSEIRTAPPPTTFSWPLPPPPPLRLRPTMIRPPRPSSPCVFWPPTPATTSCEPAPVTLTVPVPRFCPMTMKTRPFVPVPATLPPPVMFSVALAPAELTNELPPTVTRPLSPPIRTDPPVVTVIELVAPAAVDMLMPGSELSVAGFDREPVTVRFPPLPIVTLALLLAVGARPRNACPPPLARSRVMVQPEPAPLIVTLPVTRPLWPLLFAIELKPLDDRVPPFAIVSVPVVVAPDVPKPARSVPAPTVSDPNPLTEPPLIAKAPVEPAALPTVLKGQASVDEQVIRPPFDTVTVPVPQLPMSSPLKAPPPVRWMTLPAPLTVTNPTPKPPTPGTICAAVSEPPPVTLNEPCVPLLPLVKPRKMRCPLRSTIGPGLNAGATSPDALTDCARTAPDAPNASTAARASAVGTIGPNLCLSDGMQFSPGTAETSSCI